MNLTIKQLTQNGTIFVPQTVSEAVLVKNGEQVITLDKALARKLENIETPEDSGLTAQRQESNVIITHTNKIAASGPVSPMQIQYDNNGHIVQSQPLGKSTITIKGNTYAVIDGTKDVDIQLGDDFDIDDSNNIKLQWNNL